MLLKEVEFINVKIPPVQGIKIPAGTIVQWDYYEIVNMRFVRLTCSKYYTLIAEDKITKSIVQFL